MRANETADVRVAIRKRPLNDKELRNREKDIVQVRSKTSLSVIEEKVKFDLTRRIEETVYDFDYAFNEHCSNEAIYQQAVQPLISRAFTGTKVSCFAYGQTGSGKTFTMNGIREENIPGIYYFGASHILNMLQWPEYSHLKATVTFYELYCNKAYDLLNGRKELRQLHNERKELITKDREEMTFASAEDFMAIMAKGNSQRTVAPNASNERSSRSHAILKVTLWDRRKAFTTISFIDLAGSERGADHANMNQQTRADGAQINKSLLALKEVLRSLGSRYINFAGSVLTKNLKQCLVGDCVTLMICTLSPNSNSSESTMNTLKYAERVRDRETRANTPGNRQDQMMLPRAGNNKFTVEVGRDDDAEDIRERMEEERRRFGGNQPREEAMEVERPGGRQTNNIFERRQTMGPSHQHVELEPEPKPEPARRQSEYFRHYNENSMDFSNAPLDQSSKGHQLRKMNSLQMMDKLRENFEGYCQDHEAGVREEIELFKQEQQLIQWRQCEMPTDRHHIREYLRSVHDVLRRKMENLHVMERHLVEMGEVLEDSGEEIQRQVRQEEHESRQSQLRFGSHSEDQLLQGLDGY